MAFNTVNTPVITARDFQTVTLTPQDIAKLNARGLPTGLSKETEASLALAGLSTGGTPATAPSTGATTPADVVGEEIVVTANRSDVVDNRLRLSALSGRETDVYGEKDRSNNILTPLHATGGLMFPYTPSIQVSGETAWTANDLTHTNFDVLSYQRTASANIGVTGKFTIQNQREGEYALAVIHFLRTVGKMYYGNEDSAQSDPQNKNTTNSLAGLPPPVLRLRGYGTYMFNDLKCVLKGYSFAFEENMDLVTVQTPTGDVTLPPMFSITLTLGLQNNLSKVKDTFALNKFRTGELMRSGGWF